MHIAKVLWECPHFVAMNGDGEVFDPYPRYPGYLHAYGSVPDARASIGRFLDLYNRRRRLPGLSRQADWRQAVCSVVRSGNSVRTTGATSLRTLGSLAIF